MLKMKKLVFVLFILASFAGCNKMPKDLREFIEDRLWQQGYWADETVIPLLCVPKLPDDLPGYKRELSFLFKSNGELLLCGRKR